MQDEVKGLKFHCATQSKEYAIKIYELFIFGIFHLASLEHG
jgi:hypothetical protein